MSWAPPSHTRTAGAQGCDPHQVVRAVSEVEALGYFDAVNCYDHAFASLGLCHWTAGTRVWHPENQPGRPPRELWDVANGELWAFWAYLRTRDQTEFNRMVGHFGLAPDRPWVGNGQGGTPSPWDRTERKYAARGTETDDAGAPQPMNGHPPGYGQFGAGYGQFGEHEYLRCWHWFHRFSMSGRTSQGLWQAMWDMARMRIRDILDTEWNNPAVPAASQFALDPGTRLRDVFRSERTMALIYRWHIFAPGRVFQATAGPGTAGAASKNLHAILTAANAAGPSFGTNPATWGDAHEQALATAILDRNPCPHHPNHNATKPVDPGHTLQIVNDWPDWSAANPASNPRNYHLDLTTLPAAERELRLTRGSFQFDADGLPS